MRRGAAPGRYESGAESTLRQVATGPGARTSCGVTQNALPSSALYWAPVRPSPEERPVRRRPIQGIRCSRAKRRSSTRRLAHLGGTAAKQRCAPVVLRRQPQRLPDRLGDPRVPVGRQMQPVDVPQLGIAQHGCPVQIDDQGSVPGGQVVDQGEQLLHPRTEALHHRTVASRAAHEHKRSARGREALHGLFEACADHAHVALGPQRVIESADECDDVRTHGGGHIDLLVDDLADQLAPYGEIRVAKPGARVAKPWRGHRPSRGTNRRAAGPTCPR